MVSHFVSEAVVPTELGSFTFSVFTDPRAEGDKEAVVLTKGDLSQQKGTHVRVQDQCMTSEVFTSKKCDCRLQLMQSMQHIQQHSGMIIYLQQEGRGIGLGAKIAAYALQAQGMDTVEANEAQGLPAEARTYNCVPHILSHFNIPSITLMTNNPYKIESLERLGVRIVDRISITPKPFAESVLYMETKQEKMGHMYVRGDVSSNAGRSKGTSRARAKSLVAAGAPVDKFLVSDALTPVREMLEGIQYRIRERSRQPRSKLPFVTVTYAQALDGTIGIDLGENPDSSSSSLRLSGSCSLAMTMALRALHSSILVGVGTVLTDDPRLTVRLVGHGGDQERAFEGRAGAGEEDQVQQPLPVILDTALRTPPTCRLITCRSGANMSKSNHNNSVVILTTEAGPGDGKEQRRNALEAVGACVVVCKQTDGGKIDFSDAFLTLQRDFGCTSVMVEGGAQVLSSLLSSPTMRRPMVDSFVVTVSPSLHSGLRPEYENIDAAAGLRFEHPEWVQLGNDVVFHSTRQLTVEEMSNFSLSRGRL